MRPGAVLLNMETGEILVAKAKTVIICTGGAGRLHYQGFPTSNHYGATADGLCSRIAPEQSCFRPTHCNTIPRAWPNPLRFSALW